MSDFSGLNVALSALYAQRRGLEITGHNIANANTDGYSRQRVELESIGGPRTGTFHSKSLASGGGGVNVAGITRFRDAFLEVRAAIAHGDQSSLSRTSTTLSQLQDLFAEPSDLSISKSMSDFFAGWDDVANHPSDAAARSQLLERATTLASTINSVAGDLGRFRTDAISEMDSYVTEVNTLTDNISKLNDAIRSTTIAGLNASDLQDQRDVLVTKLAELVGATVRTGEHGQVNVFLNGTALVNENIAQPLALDASGSPVVLRFTGSNHIATVSTGRAGGLLGVINTTLPKYVTSLDSIALKLRDDVNALHTAGAGLDAVTGRKFFDATSALDLSVSSDIGTNTDHIAAGAVGAGVLDSSVALDIAELTASTTGAHALYRSLIVGLGVEAQSTDRRMEIQGAATEQIDGARDSAAGVNTDEEMVAMVQYQHAYEAAARYMTTIDEMLDTLVNRTGTVGR